VSQTWSNDFLNRMKNTGDDLAESVIESLNRNKQLELANKYFAQPETNTHVLNDLPAELQRYIGKTSHLPEWADRQKILLAQHFFSTRGPVFGAVLLCGSLPVLYAGGLGGAQVLAATGQMSKHYERRAGETLRFILSAMEPGGLDPQAQGIRTIQRVRLMHAAIRHYAKHSPDKWPAKPDWGVPINQEELVGTLLAFSSQALIGLNKMGVVPTEEEKQAYFHTWKVIGHLLGISPEIIPETLESAAELWAAISRRNFMPSAAGRELAKAHLHFLEGLVPGHIFDGVVVALMRYLMGRKITEHDLGFPKPGFFSWLICVLRGVFGFKESLIDCSRTIKQIAEHDSILFMEGLANHWMRNDSKPFQIPASLTQR